MASNNEDTKQYLTGGKNAFLKSKKGRRSCKTGPGKPCITVIKKRRGSWKMDGTGRHKTR